MMAQRSVAERAKHWSLEKLAVTVMGHCWVAQSGFRIQGEKDLGMARDDKKNQQKKINNQPHTDGSSDGFELGH
jgi:hypothetical protein